ncbi:hypothetical protein HDV01_006862 [Terramyces sp. JEL0728]|nr:hypothetical protein HDV01_006862 [Terramyces sp. JEL0728]
MPKINVCSDNEPPVEIYYSVIGAGPHKLFFVNGMGSISQQWDYQVEYFSQFEQFSICVFDNRGSGFSTATPGRYTTSLLAKDAYKLIEHLEWESIHLIGLSMGGMISQELAHMLKDRVASLTLISTYSKFNGLPVPKSEERFSPFKLAGNSFNVVRSLLTPPVRGGIEEFADQTVGVLFPKEWLSLSSKQPGKTHLTNYEFMIDRYSETGLQSPVGRSGQRSACLTHYFDKRLAELAEYDYPKLVITGDSDSIVRQPASSQYLAGKLKGKLVIYPNGGHALRMQDPEWHNQTLMEHFLEAIHG